MVIRILRSTINMKEIQYINIFERITGIKTKYCFEYNGTIIFAVPSYLIPRAIGENGNNIRRLSGLIARKIKIVAIPASPLDIAKFIEAIVYPIKFRGIMIQADNVIIHAGPRSKALVIGRNKIRLNSLKDILGKYFGIREIIVK